MPAAPMPAAEVHVDSGLVRRLLGAQFPQWAELELTPFPSPGWDNALFRVGDDLLARLPRRLLGAELVPKEHRWLPELAPHLPFPVPVPLGRGVPGEGYPWHWSVCPWLDGDSAAVVAVTDPGGLASDLGSFMAALHRPGPADGPRSAWRGIPLSERDEATHATLAALSDSVDVPRARRAWEEALAAPGWPGPDVWVHGDLHPANLLVRRGRLSAVLDFGDLVVGDPATDLVVAWMLLPAGAHPLLQEAAGADEATWARGRGWAVTLGLAMMANSADNPLIEGIGRRALERALEV